MPLQMNDNDLINYHSVSISIQEKCWQDVKFDKRLHKL